MKPFCDLSNEILDRSLSDQWSYLKHKAEGICQILREQGIQIEALHDEQREMVEAQFFKKSKQEIQLKLEWVTSYLQFLQHTQARGLSLNDKRHALKAFLSRSGLVLPYRDCILELLDEDTYFEIYDTNFTQIFRSADFFTITGHSLLALECCEWFQLFSRSEALVEEQMKIVGQILSGQIRNMIFYPVSDHTVKELNSPDPRSSQAQVVLYGPIFDEQGTLQCMLHFFRVTNSNSLKFELID